MAGPTNGPATGGALPAHALANRAERTKSHVKLSGSQRGESIQKRIITALRKNGERLRDLFQKMDSDKSQNVDRAEFAHALKTLHIIGGMEDYYSLFDAWDMDKSGSIELGELLAALSGRRYDAFDSFDADLGDRNAKIASRALEAYRESGRREAALARRAALSELDEQSEWLRGRCLAAAATTTTASATTASPPPVAPDRSLYVDPPRPPRPELPPSEDPLAESEASALREAHRVNDLALTLHLADTGAAQLEAENRLLDAGVAYELLALPPRELLPVLSGAVFARVVGRSDEALQRLPAPAFFGPLDDDLPRATPTPDRSRSATWARFSDRVSEPPLALSRPAPSIPRRRADTGADAPVALVLVVRLHVSEDLSWLARLPETCAYHVVQLCGETDPSLPGDAQHIPPPEERGGGVGRAYLFYMAHQCRANDRYRARRAAMKDKHVKLDRREQKQSIQQRIYDELRSHGQRVIDLFRKWDCDRNNAVSKEEFRKALAELKIKGSHQDYDSLFAAWDVDQSGHLTYTELLAALSGSRYDAILDAPPPPPFPPLLICTPANPFEHNPRWQDDVELLVSLAATATGEAGTAALPPYTPLSLHRGPLPCTSDHPSWARPDVSCDPSGAPHSPRLLPISAVWRRLFGPARPVPLWIGYTPGSIFAVSRAAVLAPRPAAEPTRAPSELYLRAARSGWPGARAEPISELILERLWRHLFVPGVPE